MCKYLRTFIVRLMYGFDYDVMYLGLTDKATLRMDNGMLLVCGPKQLIDGFRWEV